MKKDRLTGLAIMQAVRSELTGSRVTVCSRPYDALSLLQSGVPDIALLGIQTEDVDGLDYIPDLIGRGLIRRTIAISGRLDKRTLRHLSRMPLLGILDGMETDPEEIGHCVRAALAEHRYLGASVARGLTAANDDPRRDILTAREELVLSVLGNGADNETAAARIGLSPGTIRKHRENIMAKLDLRHKGQLIEYAFTHYYVRVTSAGMLHPGFEKALRRGYFANLAPDVKLIGA